MMRAKVDPDTTVRMSRVFRAPVQRIFDAFTHIAVLRKWWGGEHLTTHELILDPKIHGEFHWVYSDAKGHLHTVNGEVRELVSREKLMLTWVAVEGTPHLDHDDHHHHHGRRKHTQHLESSVVTIDFREGQGVEIRILHTGLPDKASRDEHEADWKSSLDKLEKLLAPPTAAPHRAASSHSHASHGTLKSSSGASKHAAAEIVTRGASAVYGSSRTHDKHAKSGHGPKPHW